MGRKQRVSLPPPAGSSSGAVILPITVGQLANWAKGAGLDLTCDDLDSVAQKVTDALEYYPMWALLEQRREAPALMRDWCKQVSGQARDLLFAFGMGSAERGTGAHRDAMLNLAPGWDQKNEKDRSALHQLDRQAYLAVPDRWRQLQSEGRETPGRDVFGNAGYERLAASLRLLETLSARAAAYHGFIKVPGGKGRGGARLGLFIDLSRAYRDLFGALPGLTRQRKPALEPARNPDAPDSFTNAGPAWRFFRLLLDHVHTVANQELAQLPAGETGTEAAEVRAQWDELVKAASTASGMAGEGDPLAHLLRTSGSKIKAADGRRVSAKRRAAYKAQKSAE